MNDLTPNWKTWQAFFAARSGRPLPGLDDSQDYSGLPASVARSLAIFQLGESGGGTIVEQARDSCIPGAGRHYAVAMQLFVAEEHRHAEILAICVRKLGGSLIRRNWTASLFVFFRRLIGLRLKVLVLLTAEIVGICYYHLLSTRLPASRLRSLLEQIVEDERSHFQFHCSFLRVEVRSRWRRLVFKCAWRLSMSAAAIVTLIDHRAALRDLELPAGVVWRRWMTYGRLAERLITVRHGGTQAAAQGFVTRVASWGSVCRGDRNHARQPHRHSLALCAFALREAARRPMEVSCNPFNNLRDFVGRRRAAQAEPDGAHCDVCGDVHRPQYGRYRYLP